MLRKLFWRYVGLGIYIVSISPLYFDRNIIRKTVLRKLFKLKNCYENCFDGRYIGLGIYIVSISPLYFDKDIVKKNKKMIIVVTWRRNTTIHNKMKSQNWSFCSWKKNHLRKTCILSTFITIAKYFISYWRVQRATVWPPISRLYSRRLVAGLVLRPVVLVVVLVNDL